MFNFPMLILSVLTTRVFLALWAVVFVVCAFLTACKLIVGVKKW